MLKNISIKTNKRCQFKDITSEVLRVVTESGVTSGIVVVQSPHTTAGITINENADPDVQSDMVMKVAKFIDEKDKDFKHYEGNSDSHIKSSLFGASENIIIEKGELLLGRWQGIYFCEFDGPRERNFRIKIIQG